MKIKLPNISFEITPSCNLSCRYCYNHWKAGKSVPAGSYKIARKTLKQLLRLADVDNITFTGGEPLMAERFLEQVLFVRMKGISVTVISNGTYADMPVYKQLVGLGVSLFELPIHSYDSAEHDYLANQPGSWEKSVHIVTELLKSGANVVGVIVLTGKNCKKVSETLKFIKSLGITRVMVNRFNIGGTGIGEVKNLILSKAEISNAYQQISEKAMELGLSVSSNVCTPICVLNPKDYKGIRFTTCSFDFLKRPVTLDEIGNIRFCNHSPVVLGNIFENSLESVINSDSVAKWKNIVPRFCKDCSIYDKCKAGCRAASEQLGLSLDYPDPIMDYIEPDKDLLKKIMPAVNR